MKIPLVVLIAGALTLATVPQEQVPPVREEMVISVYDAEWEGPWYLIIPGKLFGQFPSNFTFKEIRWIAPGHEEFYFELVDAGGKIWVRLHSDTLIYRSFIDLPGKLAQPLNADAIRFVRALKRFIADSTLPSIEGGFRFGTIPVIATAVRASADTIDGAPRIPLFAVAIRDTLGAPSVSGVVGVSRNPRLLHYPFIFLFLPEKKIGLTLHEARQEP